MKIWTMRRLVLALALLVAPLAGAGGAKAQDWLLNHQSSRFYMQTVKNNAVMETHRFTGLEGGVSREGDALVKIDLTSVASGIDVRDVRMRFLLFETFKYPHAEVSAKLDMRKLQDVLSQRRVTYPLKIKVNLHGLVQELDAPVTVTLISDKSVLVATAQPIIVNADQFGFAAGIAKLSEAVGGIAIATAASFTFDLVFETGEKVAEIEASRQQVAARKIQEETSIIGNEGCETRFSVISTTRVINFRSGSAELDPDSAPILDSVADIANRCPAARFAVTGHTDSIGGRRANRDLSEHRAQAVADYLIGRGVPRQRIETHGFGDTRPVAPNDSEFNRAKNRRIEFGLKGS
jgi:outer membrane protein OmpA-like peptidoglycan-associated protein/polyisoprenoid-binding protein YceI